MTTYANAAPPQGALFDNAPAVQTTYTMHAPKTSADYTPAVAVWPGGRTQRCNVKRALVVDAAEAREQLQRGAVCVYVRTQDDAEAVRGE
jgi:hypothetical protein